MGKNARCDEYVVPVRKVVTFHDICNQGCGVGVARIQRFLGGVGFLRLLGVRVRIFLSDCDSGSPIELFLHCTPKWLNTNSCLLKWYNIFLNFY